MIKRAFSFKGRINRTNYAVSFIVYLVVYFIQKSTENTDTGALFTLLVFLPAIWFLFAQGAKRCHDMGKSGWFQIIPFYGFIMLFAEGQNGPNEYDGEVSQNTIMDEEIIDANL